MCLLNGVLQWDESSIRCCSRRHRVEDNPLRRAGHIHAICGIEFAMQAMAVHGRLVDPSAERPKAGYLASLRDLRLQECFLDLLEDDLLIDAERLIGDDRRMVYRFSLHAGAVEVLSGQAAVILAPPPPP